ncbi:hypothetical protein H8959_022455 [Pygathrix nigripes]
MRRKVSARRAERSRRPPPLKREAAFVNPFVVQKEKLRPDGHRLVGPRPLGDRAGPGKNGSNNSEDLEGGGDSAALPRPLQRRSPLHCARSTPPRRLGRPEPRRSRPEVRGGVLRPVARRETGHGAIMHSGIASAARPRSRP